MPVRFMGVRFAYTRPRIGMRGVIAGPLGSTARIRGCLIVGLRFAQLHYQVGPVGLSG